MTNTSGIITVAKGIEIQARHLALGQSWGFIMDKPRWECNIAVDFIRDLITK